MGWVEKRTVASGGTVTLALAGMCPSGCPLACTPPQLPMPLPPYTLASLFNTSCHQQAIGMPMCSPTRGVAVRLQTAITN